MPSRNSVIAALTRMRLSKQKCSFCLLLVGTKGARCGAVFVLFYYDITLVRAVSGVIIPIMSCNKMSARPTLPHSHGLIHCPHCRWKALDDEARKPFVEEADRLRQLHQKVVLEKRMVG